MAATATTSQTGPFFLSTGILLLLHLLPVDSSSGKHINATEYIHINCNGTTNPDVCYSSLRPYANKIHKNPLNLARVAIEITIPRVRLIAALVSNLSRQSNNTAPFDKRTVEVLKNCSSNLPDAIHQLVQAKRQMGHLHNIPVGASELELERAQGYLAVACDRLLTCADDFKNVPDEFVKTDVHERMLDGWKLAYNAEGLVTRFFAAVRVEMERVWPTP